jgi:hypothetical protein
MGKSLETIVFKSATGADLRFVEIQELVVESKTYAALLEEDLLLQIAEVVSQGGSMHKMDFTFAQKDGGAYLPVGDTTLLEALGRQVQESLGTLAKRVFS